MFMGWLQNTGKAVGNWLIDSGNRIKSFSESDDAKEPTVAKSVNATNTKETPTADIEADYAQNEQNEKPLIDKMTPLFSLSKDPMIATDQKHDYNRPLDGFRIELPVRDEITRQYSNNIEIYNIKFDRPTNSYNISHYGKPLAGSDMLSYQSATAFYTIASIPKSEFENSLNSAIAKMSPEDAGNLSMMLSRQTINGVVESDDHYNHRVREGINSAIAENPKIGEEIYANLAEPVINKLKAEQQALASNGVTHGGGSAYQSSATSALNQYRGR